MKKAFILDTIWGFGGSKHASDEPKRYPDRASIYRSGLDDVPYGREFLAVNSEHKFVEFQLKYMDI